MPLKKTNRTAAKRNKRASVIVINYFSNELIHQIEQLVQAVKWTELIVVDNSGDFYPHHHETKIVKPGKNMGFGNGCNLGAKQAHSPLLLFLNPDATLSAETLHELIQKTPGDIDNTIWGPSILDNASKVTVLQQPGRWGLAYRRTYLDIKNPYRKEHPALFISGACLIIGKNLFDRIHGFCEDIFLYAEDLDLCVRAKEHGARIVMLGNLFVHHRGGRSTTKIGPRLKRLFRSYNGHYRFLRNHGFSRLPASLNAMHLASGIKF
jgi:GT2 family glycosyltransferase